MKKIYDLIKEMINEYGVFALRGTNEREQNTYSEGDILGVSLDGYSEEYDCVYELDGTCGIEVDYYKIDEAENFEEVESYIQTVYNQAVKYSFDSDQIKVILIAGSSSHSGDDENEIVVREAVYIANVTSL